MARGKSNEKKTQNKTNRKSNKKQEDNITADAAGKENADAKAEETKKVSAAQQRMLSKIAEWETPEKILVLEGWATDGCTMTEIAGLMHISKDTLYRWMKISSVLSDAIKKGKDEADYAVQRALFTAAMSGNVLAQIFWLKNRRPDKWRDKIEQNIEQKVDAEIEHSGGVVLLAPRLEEDDG